MKTSMNAVIFVLLAIFASYPVNAESECESFLADDSARKIAYIFLNSEKVTDQYFHAPESTVSHGCDWFITFKRVSWKTVKPSTGVVIVNKITKKAKWQPQK